mgnify:CR=1 FL=1
MKMKRRKVSVWMNNCANGYHQVSHDLLCVVDVKFDNYCYNRK